MADRWPLFIRTMNGLAPHNIAASEALKGLALGKVVRAEISRPRNADHHRLYWALCQKIADAIPGDYTAQNISDVLKLKTGHCDTVQTRDGLVRIPKSISWAKMDQAAFSDFYARCLVVICQQWLPGMKPSALKAQIEEMAA